MPKTLEPKSQGPKPQRPCPKPLTPNLSEELNREELRVERVSKVIGRVPGVPWRRKTSLFISIPFLKFSPAVLSLLFLSVL